MCSLHSFPYLIIVSPVCLSILLTPRGERSPQDRGLHRLDTGTQLGLDTHRSELENATEAEGQEFSALGESFDVTPMLLPVRGSLDSIRRLLKGDLHIGRGSRQRSLGKSRC